MYFIKKKWLIRSLKLDLKLSWINIKELRQNLKYGEIIGSHFETFLTLLDLFYFVLFELLSLKHVCVENNDLESLMYHTQLTSH